MFESGRSTGESEEIDNIFVTSKKQADEVAKFIGTQLSKRNEYKVEVIGGLEIETLDTSVLETKYDKKTPSTVIQKSLKYDGAVNTDLVFVMNK